MSGQDNITVSAILVAAGTGSRCVRSGSAMPKQFLQLLGRSMYTWPLTALRDHPAVDRVVLVTLEEMVASVQEEIDKMDGSTEIIVIAGGATRQESVFNGLDRLAKVDPTPSHVLVHDAARPFLLPDLISETITTVGAHGACTTCIPASDTIKRIHDGVIMETLDREFLVQVQTPQAARFDWLYEAHRSARECDLATTDDAAVLEAAGRKVSVVMGSPYNLKVTRPEDLILAEALAEFIFSEAKHSR